MFIVHSSFSLALLFQSFKNILKRKMIIIFCLTLYLKVQLLTKLITNSNHLHFALSAINSVKLGVMRDMYNIIIIDYKYY